MRGWGFVMRLHVHAVGELLSFVALPVNFLRLIRRCRSLVSLAAGEISGVSFGPSFFDRGSGGDTTVIRWRGGRGRPQVTIGWQGQHVRQAETVVDCGGGRGG